MAFGQEYTVIIETSQQDLVKQVNGYLQDGWRCEGGVVLGRGYEMMQTLIRNGADRRSRAPPPPDDD
jgi:hypothetical protein